MRTVLVAVSTAVTQPRTKCAPVPSSRSGMLSSASRCPVATLCSRIRSVKRSCAFTTVTCTSLRPLTRAASWIAADMPA